MPTIEVEVIRFLFGLTLVLIALVLWFLGGHLTKAMPDTVSLIFGEPGQLENTFAPISALFACLASAGALFAIYAQGRQFQVQQFQSNFYKLLEIYKTSKQDIRPGRCADEKKPVDCFEYYTRMLRLIYFSVIGKTSTDLTSDEETALKIAREMIDPFRDEHGNISKTQGETFELSYNAFKYAIRPGLQHYIRKLYQLIKYTDSDAPPSKRGVYMAMIRTEFTKYERIILYYDILVYRDGSSFFKEMRFKKLIEKHKLLHTLDKELLFDNSAAGFYKNGAFISIGEQAYKTFKRFRIQGAEWINKIPIDLAHGAVTIFNKMNRRG